MCSLYTKVLTLIMSFMIAMAGNLPLAQFVLPKIDESNETQSVMSDTDVLKYEEYIIKHENTPRPETEKLPAVFKEDMSKDVVPVKREGAENALSFTKPGATASFLVDLPLEGLYALRLSCLSETDDLKDLKFSLLVNGALQNMSMQELYFPRIFEDDGSIKTNASGNDLRPSKIAVKNWIEFFVNDPNNNPDGFMPIYFEKGNNNIEIVSDVGGVIVSDLTVVQPQKAGSYEDYFKNNDLSASKNSSEYYQIFEAEKSLRTSHTELYPTYDRSSASTSPSDATKLKLNTIGQNTWNKPGQWIEWEITVPESGVYNIGMRARQNESRGFFTTRRVFIDGKVLFDDLNRVRFSYSMDWKIHMLGEESPFLIYLEKGKKHVVRMEATYGDLSGCISKLELLAQEMNAVYRSIIMITGTDMSIDSYRDYMLDSQIPGLKESLVKIQDELRDTLKELTDIGARRGGDSAVIERLIYQINLFLENAEKIPSGLRNFREGISGISSLAETLKKQPLEIDYLFVKSPKKSVPKADKGFFSQMWFRLQILASSYFQDYSNLSAQFGEENEIDVWVSAGRDQGQIIRDIIDNRFSTKYSTSVKLSLMQTGINETIAAGINPDVLLFNGDVVNLASREVLADISTYEKFDSIKERFVKNAFVPFTYNKGIYALPLEQNTFMMFYRTDIFAQLGLEAPKTWDDFLKVLTSLQRNRLTACVPAGTTPSSGAVLGDTSIFELLTYQNGGQIFNDALTETVLDSDICNDTFKQWTEFYTRYSLEPGHVFFERFRSGEAPLGIQPITAYAQLRLGAPEIRGLWDMIPVPQTKNPEGKISNISIGAFTPAMVFKNDNEELCFEFLDWFTSSEIQIAYGWEVESLLGIGARYNSANLEAIPKLNWTSKESSLILSQMQNMAVTPVVPASYYVSRNLTNAFRRVYTLGYSPRESLLMYKDIINSEITRKNRELERRAERSKGS